MFISIFLLYATLAACAVAILLAVRRYDLYQQEPLRAVFLAVALGAAGMRCAGLVQRSLIASITGGGTLISDTNLAILAGCSEEAFKLLCVLIVARSCRHCFDEPLDGLLYGSFAGLGAALEESVWVLMGQSAHGMLPLQEPVRLAGHLVMGGIGGFGIGLIPMRSRHAAWCIPLCWLAAVLLHTLWDIAAFAASAAARSGQPLRPWHTLMPITLMLGGMLAYRALAAAGASLTRSYLQVCDARTRVCPPPRQNAA